MLTGRRGGEEGASETTDKLDEGGKEGGGQRGGNFVPLWKHQSKKHTFELLCAGTGEKEGSFRNEITC